MSGHYATLLRGTVEGLLPNHDVYITEWIDARMVPLTFGAFDLDLHPNATADCLDQLLERCDAKPPTGVSLKQDGDSSEVACDHYHRYREDFAQLRDLNQNAHRLSIEWSRIEPSEGQFDSRQLRHYRDVLGEMREQRILPMVTLHHFTSPLWFVRKGGWAATGRLGRRC